MAWFRKVKAGLVKSEITDYIGEEGNIFFNIETGECRLSDGITPFGSPCGNSGGGLTVAEVEAIIADQIDQIAADISNDVTNDVTNDVETIVNTIINEMADNGLIAAPTVEAEQHIENVIGHITSLDTPANLKPGSQEIYLNGIRLSEGAGYDYTIDPSTIDFVNGWKLFNDDVINIVYELDS